MIGEAVRRVARARAPERAKRVDRRLDPVGLLRAQLLGAAQHALAARARGREREQRQLVDRERHLARPPTVVADERRRSAPRGRRPGSPPISAPVVDGDRRAHPLEDVEQARAPRVEVDAVDVQLGAGHERRGDDERRRRGEVAGHLDLAEREPLGRLGPSTLVGRTRHARAGRVEHALGVVARRRGLDARSSRPSA